MNFKILLKRFGFLMFACFTLFCLASVVKAGSKTIKMSTTTSTENSGLLDVLLPEFTKDTGIVVKVFSSALICPFWGANSDSKKMQISDINRRFFDASK